MEIRHPLWMAVNGIRWLKEMQMVLEDLHLEAHGWLLETEYTPNCMEQHHHLQLSVIHLPPDWLNWIYSPHWISSITLCLQSLLASQPPRNPPNLLFLIPPHSFSPGLFQLSLTCFLLATLTGVQLIYLLSLRSFSIAHPIKVPLLMKSLHVTPISFGENPHSLAFTVKFLMI